MRLHDDAPAVMVAAKAPAAAAAQWISKSVRGVRGPFTFYCHLVVRCCSAQLPVWPAIERRGHIPAVRTAHELSSSSVLSSSQLFATGWGHRRPNRQQAKIATLSQRRRRRKKGETPTSSCWRHLPLCRHLKPFNNKMITSQLSD